MTPTPTCAAQLRGATRLDQAVFCENPATTWDGLCDEHWAWTDEEPMDCPGHETLNADHMGESVYCDGSCVR